MKLLHIDASILGDASVSRTLSAAVVARLAAENPGLSIVRRDLAAAPLAHLTGAHLAASAPGVEVAPQVRAEVDEGARALDEFLAADVVVIGAPMYNFGVPTQLKAWIDRLAVAGKTFRYGDDGRPVGLVGGKRVIIALSRGGYYGPETPMASAEHAESYLRAVFSFMGVTDLEVVRAEGVAVGPDVRARAIEQALGEVRQLEAA